MNKAERINAAAAPAPHATTPRLARGVNYRRLLYTTGMQIILASLSVVMMLPFFWASIVSPNT